jgi:WXG100 family type VII secretion target
VAEKEVARKVAVKYIKISTNRLGTDAEQVASLIQSIQKEMTAMKSSVQQMNSMWEGPSKEAFVQAFNQDMEDLSTLIKGLSSIQSFETQAKTKYENCEQQVEELVASIRV